MDQVVNLKIHLNEMLCLNLRPVDVDVKPGKKVLFKVPRDGASAYVKGNLRCTVDFAGDPARRGVVREVKTRGNYLLVDCEV